MEIDNSTVKTPEAEVESPTPGIQSPFGNGVLKIHAPLYHHPAVVRYRECLKNHAAAIGGHAVDGCGEFMPSPAANPSDPTSLKCAACGCHRNFHRRENDDPHAPPAAFPALEYRPNNRHHPPPPPPQMISSPNNSPSPPPISSSYFPSAPHVLMALSHGVDGAPPLSASGSDVLLSRKRFRTKFTQIQKEKMLEFAEKMEWKMQKSEVDAINGFCREIGVDKSVFKVWMHNNKHTFAKRTKIFSSIHLPPPPLHSPPPHTVAPATAAKTLKIISKPADL